MSQAPDCEVRQKRKKEMSPSTESGGLTRCLRGKRIHGSHTHAHTKRKTFPPVILVRHLKPLWKWCGLSVKEVNAEIETLDHRKKKHNKSFIPSTAASDVRTPRAWRIPLFSLFCVVFFFVLCCINTHEEVVRILGGSFNADLTSSVCTSTESQVWEPESSTLAKLAHWPQK